MPEDFVFTKAVRKAVPMLISVSGTSGSGKTYSSLLLAAGLAGDKGRVGFIDTENGRGSMYADSPGIMKALPNGFDIARLDPDFTPRRYIAAIEAAEKAGIAVLVIDSTSHEWEGIGGCVEMAETKKLRGMPNWSLAKMEHKRFMNHCLSSSMHIIFCLRAREKVKIVDVIKNGDKKQEIVPIGIQPIAEKNFVFEMLLSLQLDEQSHFAHPVKCPEPLAHLFNGDRLLAKEDGERIRLWNEGGRTVDAMERLKLRARAAAEQGTKEYNAFYAGLADKLKRAIDGPVHEENKYRAEMADQTAEQQRQEEAETADVV
jgi:hypothetical protein